MSIEFSQIPEKLNYPRHLKGRLSSLHSDIITYVVSVYDGSHDLRSKTIRLLNTVSRYVLDGDTFPSEWSSKNRPFENIVLEDEFTLKEHLDNLYINPKTINWDISIVTAPTPASSVTSSSSVPTNVSSKPRTVSKVKLSEETDKSDLYIQSPVVPQFDTSKPWASTIIDGSVYCIYTSVPEIPTKQNEISVTTDVTLMSEAQLLNLYPHNFIRTRSPIMYESLPGFKLHPKLGLLIPIQGFTEKEIIDNIVRYPHLFKLSKMKGDEVISFYNTLEVDGELLKIAEVWKELPDTSKIPYNADFVKEYVVRRYLLERDLRGIQHKYPMYGTLDPFLTLFTTSADYIHLGYSDVVDIARKCVQSRVSYKRSRNPVLRRIESNV